MCVTVGKAKLSETRIYASEVKVLLGKRTVHVLGYQNTAASDGPNAMILPIPTNSPLGPENMLDMTSAPWVLEDMEKSCQPLMLGLDRGIPKSRAKVFDKGSYTVVLARDAADVIGALRRVPSNKRPEISLAFLEDYWKLYKGWPIAVCCWSGEIKAEPLMWFFKPKYPNLFFFPALDAHDGRVPDLEEQVPVDHFLMWGTKHGGYTPRFRQPLPPEIMNLFPSNINTWPLRNTSLLNGDFWVEIGDNKFPRRINPTNFRADKLDGPVPMP
jgi:hypothetical protein